MAEKNVLSVEGLTKNYGEKGLFEDITFGIGEGQRVALVAKNGTGKSTLLKIICGLETADAGNVTFLGSVSWSYLRQEAALDPNSSVLNTLYIGNSPAIIALKNYEKTISTGEGDLQKATDAMDSTQAWNYEARAREILGKLNIHDLSRKIGSLSGGEKRRVALAQVLLEEPELIFLDEPTNHLDLDMIAWLEQRLANMGATIFMITHDRYFLENVCDRIVEIDGGSLYSYKGNFSYYLEKRVERRENAMAARDRAKKSFTRELAWMRSTPSARTGKSKSRIDRFYDIKKQAKVRLHEDPLHLTVIPERLGGKIVEFHNVSYEIESRSLFKNLTYHFKKDERIGIVGPNGSGKTTLLKVLQGLAETKTGKVVVGDTVVFGYYNQQGGNFPEEWKVIDAVRDIAEFIPLKGGAKLTASQLLERFHFPRNMQHQYIKLLSGGERKRLHLLRVLMKNPNFLILDEPTNDLDIFTLSVLEDFLIDYSGCLIVVSHDRYFMDKVIDHVWSLGEEEEIKDYPGNYTQYRLAVKEGLALKKKAQEAGVKKDVEVTVKGDYSKRLSYKEKLEFEKLEPRIAELEAKRDEFAGKLESCNDHNELIELGEKLGEISEELEESEMRWLELSERAE